jgi:AcrR family transcriptional regulator
MKLTGLNRKERERLARNREILSAAERIFAQKGFHSATMDEIASHAELAKGTIYLYFENKRDIFYTLVDEKVDSLMKLVKVEIKREAQSVERLKRLVKTQLEFFQNNRDFFRIIITEQTRFELGIKDEFRKRMMQKHLKYINIVARIIQSGIEEKVFKSLEPRKVASALTGIVNGFTFQWLRNVQGESLVSNAGLIMELFLEGVLKDRTYNRYELTDG